MKILPFTILTIATAIVSHSAPLLASDWPGWRGVNGSGIADEKNLPLTWSPNENVRWRVELPERGNSSPIVSAGKVFVTQTLSSEKRRTLICFERTSGKLLWQSGPIYAENEQTQRDNPYCSATPVSDGERVIASFGSAGLYCYDFAGKELWHRDFGKMRHMFGNAASPMLAGDLCILNFGPDEKARLIAVNKLTGETVWEAEPQKSEAADPQPRPQSGGPGGGRGRGGGGSWSTPLLIKTDGREELLVVFPGQLVAFEARTGKQLWASKGLGETIYSSPVSDKGMVVAMNSGPGGGSAIAVKAGGSGDVTETQRVWRRERIKSGMGSGVIHEGHLYTISQEGIAACIDLKDGTSLWEERLQSSSGRGSSWSSILFAEGKLYVPNQSGDVFVLSALPKFELLASNSVRESTNASLAASNGEIFLRTDKALWCFGAAKE